MKKIISLLLIMVSTVALAQQQSFDIATFTPPKGWKKQNSESAVQFSQEDAAKGTYCIITLMRSIPGVADPKANFNVAWETIVKQMVAVSTPPEMQAPSTENGWETRSGYAPFVSDGEKGIAVLITATGFEKMMNMLVLTNTNVYEIELTAFLESISLSKLTAKKHTDINTNIVAKQDGCAFSTTNFDDGWISTVQEDWVQVTKGNIKVLIHYPNKKADEYNPVLLEGLKKAWDVLVAPRYSSATNFEFKPISGWQSIEFAEADCIEKLTGKTVHIVLFKYNYTGGNGKYLEFITPDKKTYEKEFGVYHQDSYGWEKVEKMASYNRFAVAATDLKGKWTNNFSGLTQYVNANTGASAGSDTHASNEVYEFAAGNMYKWSIGVASGFVGNIKFQSAKSSGKFFVPNNWQVNFSDIEGKPKNYNVAFSCIKGARILWIDNKGFGRSE